MSAYLIVDIAEILDSEVYARYRGLVSPGLRAAGGRYLARGGTVDVLEGSWTPGRLVVVEFATVETARHWWGSAAYAELRDLRQRSTRSNLIVVEGLTDEEA